MMNEQTLQKMRSMKLYGMYRNFKHVLESPLAGSLTEDELLNQLVECEWDERNNRAVERSLRNARFRYKASLEMVDRTNPSRGIDQLQLERLADCQFIQKRHNLIITGSTGKEKVFSISNR
jgi:DNA replication protein DnaC